MSKKGRNKVKIAGVNLTSTTADSLLVKIIKRLEKGEKTFISTPNPEFIVFSQNHPWFKKALNKAHFSVPDGVGLLMAAKFQAEARLIKLPLLLAAWAYLWLGLKVCLAGIFKPDYLDVIPERITGVDLVERLAKEAAERNWTVYLLGGLKPGVAQKALDSLKKRYPGLKGWAAFGPWLKLEPGSRIANQVEERSKHVPPRWTRVSEKKVQQWVNKINRKKPDLLFLALSMEKQLKFILPNLDRLNVKLVMGVGGALDYHDLGGQVQRAPSWAQKAGLEWLFRLGQEPARLKRIIRASVVFPFKILLDSLANR